MHPGFDIADGELPLSLGSRFAMRGGFILCLCHYYGLICSIEQPRGSVMYRMDIYQMILKFGFYSVCCFPFLFMGHSFSEVELVVGKQPVSKQVEEPLQLRPAWIPF